MRCAVIRLIIYPLPSNALAAQRALDTAISFPSGTVNALMKAAALEQRRVLLADSMGLSMGWGRCRLPPRDVGDGRDSIATLGGFLLAFGGTRTFHRLVCAIEDAGFVIQDTIMWLYGSGFPKRRDALKPASAARDGALSTTARIARATAKVRRGWGSAGKGVSRHRGCRLQS